jgi:peptide/nickel transport system permease protein
MDFTALLQPPSLHHLMGTDALGHDVLTQWLYGGRYSLFIGLSTTVVMVLVGTPLGAIAGYFGGFVDNILMRLTDLLLTFPVLLLQIALAAQMGGKQSVALIIILIAGFSWMVPARLIRGEVLSLKSRDFVSAARAVGASDWRVIFRHLMPNAIAPMLVSATLNIGGAIVTEAALSFLGMGVQPPTPTWGNMIGFNQNNAMTAPWLILFPGFAVVLTVLAVNFIGDGIRDALDPTAMAQK